MLLPRPKSSLLHSVICSAGTTFSSTENKPVKSQNILYNPSNRMDLFSSVEMLSVLIIANALESCTDTAVSGVSVSAELRHTFIIHRGFPLRDSKRVFPDAIESNNLMPGLGIF